MKLFRRIRRFISNKNWEFRRNLQRFRRGWAYTDVWDLDSWFIGMLEPMLRHLKEHHSGSQAVTRKKNGNSGLMRW